MIVGADIAINHGCLVDETGAVLLYYTDGLGMLSSTAQLYDRAVQLADATPLGATVAIDWDREQGAWGSAGVGILITMLVSFYGALLITTRGARPHYVTPGLVRYCLGLTDRTKKKLVHDKARSLWSVPEFEDDAHGDKLDAWILAQSFYCTKEQFTL